jgi:hypothetical protein
VYIIRAVSCEGQNFLLAKNKRQVIPKSLRVIGVRGDYQKRSLEVIREAPDDQGFHGACNPADLSGLSCGQGSQEKFLIRFCRLDCLPEFFDHRAA